MNQLYIYNKYALLLGIFLLLLGMTYLATLLHGHFYPEPEAPVTTAYLVLRFGLIVLVGPLLETLIFQHWLIRFSIEKLHFLPRKKRFAWAIVISAILFGAGHTQDPLYVVLAIVVGVLLAATYLLFYLRKDFNPILAVFLIHAADNLTGFVLDHVLHLL